MIHRNLHDQMERSSFVTATIDEILLFLSSLKPLDYIDSRILFQCMNSSVVECTMQHEHKDWITFACEASEFDFLPFCGLDLHMTSQNEEYLLLSPDQARLLVLYTQHPQVIFLPDLRPYLATFLQEYNGRQFQDPWFVAMLLVNKMNKTLEELQIEMQKETKKEKEKAIEQAFCEYLEQHGTKARRQVHCLSGIADIVTPDAIYEVKATLTYQNIRHAIAQVLAYRVYINPAAKVYIVGCRPANGKVGYELAQALGVEVIVWDISTAMIIETTPSIHRDTVK